MIAAFTKTERDFKELGVSPKSKFIRVKTIDDLRGRKFNGIIRFFDWYKSDTQILDAYDYLRTVQPEIFE
jgi:hypothetical protein